MAEIYNKLNYLNSTKTAIRAAIVAKGIAITNDDSFRSYADKINAIKGDSTPKNFIDTSVFCSEANHNLTITKVDENGKTEIIEYQNYIETDVLNNKASHFSQNGSDRLVLTENAKRGIASRCNETTSVTIMDTEGAERTSNGTNWIGATNKFSTYTLSGFPSAPYDNSTNTFYIALGNASDQTKLIKATSYEVAANSEYTLEGYLGTGISMNDLKLISSSLSSPASGGYRSYLVRVYMEWKNTTDSPSRNFNTLGLYTRYIPYSNSSTEKYSQLLAYEYIGDHVLQPGQTYAATMEIGF